MNDDPKHSEVQVPATLDPEPPEAVAARVRQANHERFDRAAKLLAEAAEALREVTTFASSNRRPVALEVWGQVAEVTGLARRVARLHGATESELSAWMPKHHEPKPLSKRPDGVTSLVRERLRRQGPNPDLLNAREQWAGEPDDGPPAPEAPWKPNSVVIEVARQMEALAGYLADDVEVTFDLDAHWLRLQLSELAKYARNAAISAPGEEIEPDDY
jgi:hypothetical protein